MTSETNLAWNSGGSNVERRSGTKPGLLLGAFCLVVLASLTIRGAHAQDVRSPDPGDFSRLTGSYIRATGQNRPGLALGLASIMQSVSVNGYTQRFSPLGLTPLNASGPIVILDGQPQFFDVYGRQQLNLLPFSVEDIKDVQVESVPSETAAYRSEAGRIIVRTRRPQGLSLRGSVSFANEIDDPGPFRYTDQATPNIDRDGPRVDLRLSHGAAPWFAQASYRRDEYHATGERLTKRVWTTFDGATKPRLVLEAPEGLVAYRSEQTEHTFRAGTVSFSDFLFLDAIGREIPFRQSWKYATASGLIGLSRAFSLGYLVDRRQLEILNVPSKFEFGPDLSEDRTTATVSLKLDRPSWTVKTSGGYSLRNFAQSTPAKSFIIERARGSLEAEWRSREGFLQQLTLLLTSPFKRWPEARELGYAASWRLEWTATDGSGAHIAASVSEQHQAERSDLPDLIGLGMMVPFPDVHSILTPTISDRKRTIHVESSVRFVLSQSVSAQVTGAVRDYEGLTVASYTREYFPWIATFDNVTEFKTGVSGRVVSIGGEIRHQAGTRFDHSVAYFWTQPGSLGNSAFEDAWSPLAGHRAVFTGLWRPADRFRVFTRVTYRSARSWADYREVPSHKRPASILADVTVQKDLWYDHLTLSVSGINVGNVAYRSHPASEPEHLALRVSIRGRISDPQMER